MYMSLSQVLFSSETDVWETPQNLFNQLNLEFGFQVDVCAFPSNAKCNIFYTPQQDGLTHVWRGVCWMNPPYGEPEHPCKPKCKKKKCVERGFHNDKYTPGAIDWVRKAYESSLDGATVVCLLPSRTDTAWWHDYCMKGEIRLIKGRLKFGDSKCSAPFPSAIVIFRPEGKLSIQPMDVDKNTSSL